MLQNPHALLTFDKVHNPLRLPREATSELPKVVRTPGVFNILTSKCASRHNGVHFFDIWTSKSDANMWCFVHFDFEMCFAPQRRALFRHLNFQKCFAHFDLEMCFAPQRRALFRHRNFQKWSEAEVFCTFWLGNVLCATTACNFSSLIWPAGSAPAVLFDPPKPQIIGKTECLATFLPFRASASSFFWLFLFSDLLSSNLSLLSASALLCFSSVHIVGSLTSKLPSRISKNATIPVNIAKHSAQKHDIYFCLFETIVQFGVYICNVVSFKSI